MVPLKRLTTIVMPHRAARPTLRSKPSSSSKDPISNSVTVMSDYRKMSAIQILKHGLSSNLWKKEGWLFDLLQNEGMADGTKQNRKELCWSYFKSQQLYIEAVQDAKNDPEFDPRRSLHLTGKDGRYMKKKNASTKPKNPLTIQYLCFAFAISYATFKRWKIDAFESKIFVPAHKGKSVLTDKKWASQIFNNRKMYVKHEMDLWLAKHPAKKHDSKGKKVHL